MVSGKDRVFFCHFLRTVGLCEHCDEMWQYPFTNYCACLNRKVINRYVFIADKHCVQPPCCTSNLINVMGAIHAAGIFGVSSLFFPSCTISFFFYFALLATSLLSTPLGTSLVSFLSCLPFSSPLYSFPQSGRTRHNLNVPLSAGTCQGYS